MRRNRIHRICCTCPVAALVLLLTLAPVVRAADRPNIVIILADDMGYSDIGCFGGEIATPNIDKLAAEGIRFTQFYNGARCSPSRAALLTGLYPHQAGMGHLATFKRDHPSYRGELNDRCVTIAEALRQAGYRTMMSGKWHLGTSEPAWPNHRGFDRSFGEHSFVDDYFKPQFQLFLDGRKVEPEGDDWYSTDVYTDFALNFLEEAQREHGDKPFFLYMAYNAPHFPLQAREEDTARYRGKYMEGWDALRQRRFERMKELGILQPTARLSPRDEKAPPWESVDEKAHWDLKMAAYAAQVDRMDRNIGRLLNKLSRLGAAENTLVLFLSDNGGCAETFIDRRNPPGAQPGDRNCKLAYGPPWANLSDVPFREFKRYVHEGGISTPLIARWPRGIRSAAAGTISHEPGHLIDIMPTCLEAAGAEYPLNYAGRPRLPVDGISLVPLFAGRPRAERAFLAWEHEGNCAVRAGDWKLVSQGDAGGAWELYDLSRDRAESNNLAAQQPQKVAELSAAYANWAARVGVVPWEQIRARPPAASRPSSNAKK